MTICNELYRGSRFALTRKGACDKKLYHKYSHLTYRLTYLVTKTASVITMSLKISKEYLSTFKRRIQTQIYNEIRRDYSFPRIICRTLSELFNSYFDLYFSSQRKEGQIIFSAVSRDVPPGVPVEEMHLIPIHWCSVKQSIPPLTVFD